VKYFLKIIPDKKKKSFLVISWTDKALLKHTIRHFQATVLVCTSCQLAVLLISRERGALNIVIYILMALYKFQS